MKKALSYSVACRFEVMLRRVLHARAEEASARTGRAATPALPCGRPIALGTLTATARTVRTLRADASSKIPAKPQLSAVRRRYTLGPAALRCAGPAANLTGFVFDSRLQFYERSPSWTRSMFWHQSSIYFLPFLFVCLRVCAWT